MSVSSGFFTSQLTDGVQDRRYGSDAFNNYLSQIMSDGVLMARNSNALQVYAGTGLQVAVRAGEGRFHKHWFTSDAIELLTIATADVTLARIDRIVVRVSYTNRNITFAVLTGTPASNPTAPALTRTADIYEYSLAQVRVPARAVAISQSNITDERLNTSVCGVVASLVTQLDTETLDAQYQAAMNEMIDDLATWQTASKAEFDAWFNEIKDEVTSTSILREYKSNYTTLTANVTIVPINITQYNTNLDFIEVYVNGFRMIETVQYTKSTDTITFVNPLSEIGTLVEIICYKSVDGSEAESVIGYVETLNSQMAEIQKYQYHATGTDDNIGLMNMINAFFNGTGDFTADALNTNGKIEVYGQINIDDGTTITTVENGNNDLVAYLPILVASNNNKHLTVDFSNAIVNVNLTITKTLNSLVEIIANNKLIIEGLKLNVTIGSNYASELDIIRSDSDINNLYVTGTSSNTYAIVVVREISVGSHITNSEIKFTAGGHLHGFHIEGGNIANCRSIVNGSNYVHGFSGIGQFVNCYVEATSSSSNAIQSANGFTCNGQVTNCKAIAKHSGSGDAFGFRVYENLGQLSLNNCDGKGYITTASTRAAQGVYVNNVTTQYVSIIGCNFASSSVAGYKQTGSIVIGGTTAGAKATMLGNTLYVAVTKHSGANINEYGTIIM